MLRRSMNRAFRRQASEAALGWSHGARKQRRPELVQAGCALRPRTSTSVEKACPRSGSMPSMVRHSPMRPACTALADGRSPKTCLRKTAWTKPSCAPINRANTGRGRAWSCWPPMWPQCLPTRELWMRHCDWWCCWPEWTVWRGDFQNKGPLAGWW